MKFAQYVEIVVALATLFGLVAWFVRDYRKNKNEDAELEARGERLLVGVEHLRRVAEVQQKRADDYFGILQGLEGERDQWQKLYYEQARTAGAAQAWLFRALGEALHVAAARRNRLLELGETVTDFRIDPRLEQLVGEFGEKHPEKAGAAIVRAPGFAAAQAIEVEHTASLPPASDNKASAV